jgi:hypothetical protein
VHDRRRSLPYNKASEVCKAMKGAYLISYNDAAEQVTFSPSVVAATCLACPS